MSAKWRALQHRHRYTYNAISLPPHFSEALNQTPNDSQFFVELKHLISLNSTYAQLEHIKKLASAFYNLLADPNSDEKSVSCAVKLFVEILFLENSLPLHRTLASTLAKCKNFRGLIEGCFRGLCEEYGDGENSRNGKRRFCVSRAALSMMSTPKLGYLVEVVEQCVLLVGLDVVMGLRGVINDTNEWSRPSPIVMEQCQEALSCMYYLLQRFPKKFYDVGSKDDGLCSNNIDVLEMIFATVLSILKSQTFSRDCFVAASVSLCAAMQVCLSLDKLGLLIMQGIFHQTDFCNSKFRLEDVVKEIPYKGDLVDEIRKFSALSRLCLIRGILTAVSRTVLDSRFVLTSDALNVTDDGSGVKTILYDAILPELFNYAENPVDGHSNFHTLTVIQICLQQIKTLLLGNDCSMTDNYDPIPEDMGARLLKIVWNNLEDPLSQTVKQVHLIFDLYLDIQSSLQWANGSENIKLFLKKIASDLLHMGPRCKGRYVPLASLTRRLGAKTILEMKPDLLFESTKAYIDDDVCCAVTTFLKCFLERLRDECWSSDGADNGYTKYRDHCLQPFLLGLASGLSKLRSNLNTYAVPVLLELDVDSIFSMLSLIGIGWGDEGSIVSDSVISCIDMTLEIEQKIAVLVSLLKVSRVLALMEGDIDWYENSSLSAKDAMLDVENGSLNCVVRIKGLDVKVPVNWLILALTHVDESLRMDAAETLFLNPKTASLPSSLELSLMRRAVPLNMRCCSTAFQMKWNSLFRKFFSRVRTALERQIKQGKWKPLVSGDADVSSYTGEEKTIKHRAEDLFDFTKWLSCFLFFSCYPSAPYERKTMAMELILIMFNVWPVVPTCRGNQDVVQFESNLYPYSKGFILPASTLLLVGSIVDSWDRLRESSFHILRYFPTPLPGISTPDLVQEAIIWAKKLICSPRVRESDAGALTLRLIFRKYVLELSWIVKPSCNAVTWPKSELPDGVYQNGTSDSPVVVYVMSLIDWLLAAVKDAENNLSEACKNSFVHGILLTIRYTFEELNSESDVFLQSIADMKHVFEKLLDLVKRITSLALWVVSADAWCLPDDMEDTMDDDAFLLEIPSVADASESKEEVDVKTSKFEQEVRPSEQIVMVGCWLAMKEVSLLLGTIIRKVPLPNPDEMEITNDGIVDESVLESGAMLDLKQLETIGDHFLEVLLKMKHMGAIDKTRAGFTALCNRLLCSNDPRLCKLTELWMEQLMERTVAKGQTVDDLLRRSAGIPAAFIAFFLSEPEGTPKRLLPRALRWLIDIVTESLTDQTKGKSSKSHRTGCIQDQPEMNANKEISKIREEGVVPTVHAFNALRAAFNDTNLATDTSGFSAEALIISIRSFSSSHWEIRNSACLAYTALVRRMVGFLNVQKRESARRALTGLEFFHRYPALHSFLFNELNVATELLSDASSQNLGSNLENAVHPSLCPMLILLARLKPSPISSATGDALDPFLFMPFIRRCSVQSNFRIRLLASRALTGLVSNEKLHIVLLNIASELPCDISHTPDSSSKVDSTKGTSSSFNSIHGILLQLNSLVDNNCRDLADSFKKDMVLHELIQILGTRSWIGRPLRCPCPILNGCIIKVLDNMLSIAGTCKESKSACLIWNLLWDLSSECLDLKPADYSFYFDPTYQELRKQAATSYFNCVYQTSKDTGEDDLLMRRDLLSSASNSVRIDGMEVDFTSFQERLIRSLSDLLYEVRIATLKWLFLFLKSRESSGKEYGLHCEGMNTVLTNINIQDTVMKLLVSEKHHKCMHYLLKILYTWNMPKSQDDSKYCVEPRNVYNMDYHSVFQLWDKLVSLFKITRHAKTRQTLICCMGICIKRLSSLYMSFIASDIKNTVAAKFIQTDPTKKFSNFYDSINYFVDLIAKNSDASETANMRKAAAESMIASGLLAQAEIVGSLIDSYQTSNKDLFSDIKPEEAVKMYARKILDLWLICIKLLEDEDANIRKRLALDVQKYLTSSKPRRNFPNGVACNQVEKVIELCFDHLSTIFGYWLEYLDYICCWVLNAANHANYIVSGGGDLVRHVFDKEIDNHHEEKLLICQICSSHLEDIPISKSPESKDLLLKWRSRFSQQLITFANDHIQKRGSSNWIGGVGNHKDAFLPVYANLLVFYALSKCILEGEPEKNIECMVSEVCALGDAINPFLGNPLICNLYMMVVKSHEKYLGGSANNLAQKWKVLNDSIWDEFNPYFLLK